MRSLWNLTGMSEELSAEENRGNVAATKDKVQELIKAVEFLGKEAERLQNNLDKMHKLQTTLYQTDLKLVEWLERGSKLKDDAHVSLEKIVSIIEKEHSKNKEMTDTEEIRSK